MFYIIFLTLHLLFLTGQGPLVHSFNILQPHFTQKLQISHHYTHQHYEAYLPCRGFDWWTKHRTSVLR